MIQRHSCAPLCPGPTPRRDPQASLALLAAQVARLERQHTHMVRMCLHCGGGGGRVVPLPLQTQHGAAAAAGPSAAAAPGGSGGGGWGGGQRGGAAATFGRGGCHGAGLGCRGARGAGVAACDLNSYNAGCGGVVCDSLDCGVYFERRKLAAELGALGGLLRSVRMLWTDEDQSST